jgi:hypothetical protein
VEITIRMSASASASPGGPTDVSGTVEHVDGGGGRAAQPFSGWLQLLGLLEAIASEAAGPISEGATR